MLTKVCITCKVEKDITNFYSCGKNKVESYCKKCSNIRRYERRKLRMESDPEYKKKFYDEKNNRLRLRKESDPEYKKKLSRASYLSTKSKMESDPEYKKKISDYRYQRVKRRMESDPEYKSKLDVKRNERRKRQYHSDPAYKFKKNTSSIIRSHFRNIGHSKPFKTSDILGIDDDGFIKYIEGLFQDGMTWENRGEWHTDHIVPVSLGNTVDEIKYLNHYTNLRPLWKDENLKKSNLIDNSNLELYNKFLKEMRNGRL